MLCGYECTVSILDCIGIATRPFSILIRALILLASISLLLFNARAKDDGRGKWINGPDIELYNFSSEEVTISFTQTGEIKGIFEPINSVTLKPKQTSKITLKTNNDKVDDFAPSAGVGLTGDKTYRGSFVAKSVKSTLNLTVQLQKQRGGNFG